MCATELIQLFSLGALDLVLLFPSPHAMRLMLQLCEQYAKEYDVIFNADKSKCIISCSCFVASRSNLAHEVCFSLSGSVIENVETWPHLRHIVINNGSDKLDILSRHCSFIGQANNVICWLSKLD